MEETLRFWLFGAGICCLGLATPTIATAGTITGRVFEDVNYGGGRGASYAASGGNLLGSVRLELYRLTGGNYVFVAATTTGTSTTSTTAGTALGTYRFANLTNAANTYVVRVASRTVQSSRGAAGPLPVPTYRTTVNNTTVQADGNYVGGENSALEDADNNTSANLADLTTGTRTALVQAPVAGLPTSNATTVANVDFGFSFDVVTNTNDAGQGSLRQFILNANALSNDAIDQRPFDNNGAAKGTDFPAGQETSIFMIPDGTARPGLRAGSPSQLTDASGNAVTNNTASRALVALTTGLDAVTGANTAIDGTTQTTLFDSNTAALGSGGTVGVDALALSQLAGPEVEVSVPSNAGGITGLTISASNCVVRGLALHGSGNATGDATFSAPANTGSTGLLLEQCGIGITALAVGTPAANPTIGTGVYLLNTSGTVRNNLIMYCGKSGINYSGGSGITGSGYTITQNELQQNGQVTAGGDNITLGRADGFASAAGPVTITQNLLAYANSSGIQLEIGGVSNNTISNNTITNNGKGGASTRLEGSGIHYLLRFNPATTTTLSTNTDLVSRNIISANQSSAVVINYGQRNVHVSQNAIYGNGDGTTGGQGLIAVDFTPASYYAAGGNRAYGQGDGVTPNDGTTDANKADYGMNYPVLTKKSVTTSGTNTVLHVEGFVGRRVNQTLFANTEIEFYRGDNSTDTNQNGEIFAGDGQNFPHGEPRTYIGTITTGSTGSFVADITVPTSAFSPALQTTDPINALAFKTGLGTSEAGINLIPNTIPAGTLPVQLVRFEAAASGRKVLLTWATASELNNDHFDVQRSTTGQDFETVGQVRGHGSTTAPQTYAFTDAPGLGASLVYYRLRQVDTDGTSAFSPVRTVRLAAETPATQPYPNPTASYTALDLSALAAGDYQLVVTNLLGEVVARQHASGGQVAALDLRHLAAGSYLVRLRGVATQLAWRVTKN